MANEQLTSLGVEYHKETQKVFAKLLLFGTLLLVSHALTIKPSEFDAAGIKIAVDDIVVVHGTLAFIYLYYLYMLVTFSVEGASFLQMNAVHRLMRARIRAARKPVKDAKLKRHRPRTAKEVKRSARWSIRSYLAFVVPFGLVFAVITIGAIILGAVDAYRFAEYLTTKSGAYDFVSRWVNGEV
jgi:hypothetical protein